ncbi:hypothetical protein B6257_18715 [Bacillus velezensis]|nr:hypothetical protein B6257_18715 [Bacillus velezensis]
MKWYNISSILSAGEVFIKALSKNDSSLLSQSIFIVVNRIKAWLSLFIYLQLNRASYPPPI